MIQLNEQANELNQTKSLIKHWCYENNMKKRCTFLFESIKWPDWLIGLVLLIVSLTILCSCLILLVKILSSIFKGKFLDIITKIINSKSTGVSGYFMGYVAIVVTI